MLFNYNLSINNLTNDEWVLNKKYNWYDIII